MAHYDVSIDTNAADEKGLDKALKEHNDARAAEVPPRPPRTKAQFVQVACEDLITKRYTRAYKEDLRQRVGAALDAATGAQVTNAAAALGVDENPYD